MTKTAPITLAPLANDGAHFGAFAPVSVSQTRVA
ncbi:hypothetical protein SAMN05216281_102310 [Cryobacterium luteum]|nr:hypothetical protein SAMN05216281_102310 [Cryobacterium luteum]